MAKTQKIPTTKKAQTKATPNSKSSTEGRNPQRTLAGTPAGNAGQQEQSSPAGSRPSPATANMLKLENENSLQTQPLDARKRADHEAPSTQTPSAPKRQKTVTDFPPLDPLTLLLPAQINAQVNSQISPRTPSRAVVYNTPQPIRPSESPPSAEKLTVALFRHALFLNPSLLPVIPPLIPVSSTQIDNIAYAMWHLAEGQVGLLNATCAYSSMFSQLKLSALAKLNLLPSWWFFREMAVKSVMANREEGGLGYMVDDRVMNAQWNDALHYARGVIVRNNAIRENAMRMEGTEEKSEDTSGQ